jgi:hypothetical protein
MRAIACEPGCAAELVDKGEKRAVLVIGGAEIAQAEMRFGVQALRQCRGDAPRNEVVLCALRWMHSNNNTKRLPQKGP